MVLSAEIKEWAGVQLRNRVSADSHLKIILSVGLRAVIKSYYRKNPTENPSPKPQPNNRKSSSSLSLVLVLDPVADNLCGCSRACKAWKL